MARKDLMQAFRELEAQRRGSADGSTDGGADQRASVTSSAAAPGAAGPSSVAEPPAVAPSRHQAPGSAAAGGVARASLFLPLVQPIVLACLALVFALGFFLGSNRAAGVSAAGPDSGSGSARPVEDPNGRSLDDDASGAFSEVNAALLDRDNRYTVLAITYDTNSARNRELAGATVQAFRDAGLPAARPQASGAALVVVVGAAPTQEDLFDLREAVRGAAAPSGRVGEFSTAGIYAIDNLIER
ncbi:hypothetical protein [Engelhardtia mirabilis]|uniref:Uncharacterized protein n=1 Tax=Engelhardtia mirabilis TaxID=2528011 RepID=A0A518BIB1_9BACT|nr:hypothetical protein Pla133_17590 [Planctomycetes bacterium Pla133]QDV01009.1 hypothetical protein Pla86_17580 [Planctomycetes bacterium Pla86]